MLKIFFLGLMVFTACAQAPSKNYQSLETKTIQIRPLDGQVGVVDGGSTGSTLVIYEVKNKKITEIFRGKKITPGLADMAKDLNGILDYLKNMKEDAQQKGQSLDGLPIYYLATAGMRNLGDIGQNRIWATINAFGQQLNLKMVAAQTITVAEEALYAWADANFPLKSPTKGTLEIGGASFQMAFAADASDTQTLANIVSLQTQEGIFPVYAHGSNENGMNQALARFNQSLDCQTQSRQTSSHLSCLKSIVEIMGRPYSNCQNGCLNWYNGAFQPSVEDRQAFIPIGAAASILDAYIKGGLTQANRTSIDKAAEALCRLSNKQIAASADFNMKDEKTAQVACFAMSYIRALFYGDGSKFVGLFDKKEPIFVQQNVNWTQGFLIFHINGYKAIY